MIHTTNTGILSDILEICITVRYCARRMFILLLLLLLFVVEVIVEAVVIVIAYVSDIAWNPNICFIYFINYYVFNLIFIFIGAGHTRNIWPSGFCQRNQFPPRQT